MQALSDTAKQLQEVADRLAQATHEMNEQVGALELRPQKLNIGIEVTVKTDDPETSVSYRKSHSHHRPGKWGIYVTRASSTPEGFGQQWVHFSDLPRHARVAIYPYIWKLIPALEIAAKQLTVEMHKQVNDLEQTVKMMERDTNGTL